MGLTKKELVAVVVSIVGEAYYEYPREHSGTAYFVSCAGVMPTGPAAYGPTPNMGVLA
jgi:hypothetical protein